MRTANFQSLEQARQVPAIQAYDDVVVQGHDAGQVVSSEVEQRLQHLLCSVGYQAVTSNVQTRITSMFIEYVSQLDVLDKFAQMLDKSGFANLDQENLELYVLEGYQNDPAFKNTVERLTTNTKLDAQTRSMTLEQMTRARNGRPLYTGSNLKDRQKIQDNIYATVTSDTYRTLSAEQRKNAIEYLLSNNGYKYALKDDGAMQALKQAIQPQLYKSEGQDGDEASAISPPRFPKLTTNQIRLARKVKIVSNPLSKSPEQIDKNLKQLMISAYAFASASETINDPLRRVASEDPLTYAYTKLAAEHTEDKNYLQLLNTRTAAVRLQDTVGQVIRLGNAGQYDNALHVLNTAMDAAGDVGERNKLFSAAGNLIFSKAWFENYLQDIKKNGAAYRGNVLTSDYKADLRTLLRTVGENGPPETASLFLDVLGEHLHRGISDPITKIIIEDFAKDAETYTGLALLVDKSDQLGGHRVNEYADLLYQHMETKARDGGRLTSGGFGNSVSRAISEYGAMRLSSALYNRLSGPDHTNDQWRSLTSKSILQAMQQGLAGLSNHTRGVVDAWLQQDATAQKFLRDAGSLDPSKTYQIILADREKHPEAAVQVDKAKLQVELQGIKIDRALRGAVYLGVDLDGTVASDEKAVVDEVAAMNNDSRIMGSVQNNVTLQKETATKIQLGNFTVIDSPWYPSAIFGKQKSHIEQLISTFHLTGNVVAALRASTSAWQEAMEQEAAKGDKASSSRFEKLTAAYENGINKLLGSWVPPEAQKLAAPQNEMAHEIIATIKASGSVGTLLRAGHAFYEFTGNAVLTAYAAIAHSRLLAGPDGWRLDSRQVGNVAQMLYANKSMVDDTYNFIKTLQDAVNAARDKDGKLSADARAKLEKAFKEALPTYPTGITTDDTHHPAKALTRSVRGLFAISYVISVLGSAASANHNPGFSSSEIFAMLYLVGAGTEAYRGVAGAGYQGAGKVADSIKASGFGKYIERQGGAGTVEDLVLTIKTEGVMGLVRLACVLWAFEDFTGESPWENDKSTPGDWRAGLITSGLVAADAVDVSLLLFKMQATRPLVTSAITALGGDATTVSSIQGWIPVLNWITAGVAASILAAHFIYSVSKAKNAYEFPDPLHQRYVDMFRSLGFTDPQLKELLNNNGGAPDKFPPGNPFVIFIGLDAYKTIKSKIHSFLKEGGLSPLYLINAFLDYKKITGLRRLNYLLSLSDKKEMRELVKYTHPVLDNDMHDDGSFDPATLQAMEVWMRGHGLWKAAYLGK